MLGQCIEGSADLQLRYDGWRASAGSLHTLSHQDWSFARLKHYR